MNYALCIALVVGAPVVKDKKAQELPPTPTGEWVAESVVENGNDLLKMVGTVTVSFADGEATLRVARVGISAKVEFNPAAKVREITLTYPKDGRASRGIYKLEGDTLTICLTDDPDAPRPTEFAGGPGTSLFVLRRAK